MKKFYLSFLAAVAAFAVTACGEKDDPAPSSCRQLLLESPTFLLLNWPSLLLSNLSSPCLQVPCVVYYHLLTLALLIGTRVPQALAMRLLTAKHGEHCQLAPSLGCALSSLTPTLQYRPPSPVTHAPSFEGGTCPDYLTGT